jgi:large subunit ribosomal protein L6
MTKKEIKEDMEIPAKVSVKQNGNSLEFSGPAGKADRVFVYPGMSIKVDGNKILMSIGNASRKEKAVINSYKAHIKNAFNGVLEGYTYKLKVCSGHFPMNVTFSNNQIHVKNFLGEKVPRVVAVPHSVKVHIEGDVITITGTDKEHVGQCAALVEQKTRRPGFDNRIFQDGIYIIANTDAE